MSKQVFLNCPDCKKINMLINIWKDHSGPQVTGGIVAQFEHGTIAELISEENGLSLVNVEGVTGWLRTSLVKEVDHQSA